MRTFRRRAALILLTLGGGFVGAGAGALLGAILSTPILILDFEHPGGSDRLILIAFFLFYVSALVGFLAGLVQAYKSLATRP